MPKVKWSRYPEEKRNKILEVAFQEFATQGILESSYNNIIKHSGVSKGVMYTLFEGKEDLYTTTMVHALNKLYAAAPFPPMPKQKENFWTLWEEHALSLATYLMNQPLEASLVRDFLLSATRGQVLEIDAKTDDSYLQWVYKLFETGQSLGVIRTNMPLRFLADICFGIALEVDQWMAFNIDTLEGEEFFQISTGLLNIYQRILQP